MGADHTSIRRRRKIIIEIDFDGTYQQSLLARLAKYKISHGALCREAKIDRSQFSRWVARLSDYTGEAMAPRLDNVLKIERALIILREKQAAEKAKEKKVRA